MTALAPRVEKSTHAKLVFLGHDDGTFTVQANWDERGQEKTFKKRYDHQEVFGTSINHRRTRHRPCVYARQLTSAILRARGI